jgi:hypothetical protein
MRMPLILAALVSVALAQTKYTGPIPPKSDVPFLLHANKLVELDSGVAQKSQRKDNTVFTVAGAGAQAKTPMAEPIFLVNSEKLNPEILALWRMTPKGAARELEIPAKPKKDSPRPIRTTAVKVSGNTFRVETQEFLENGEYCLSPEGTDQAFCFSVY